MLSQPLSHYAIDKQMLCSFSHWLRMLCSFSHWLKMLCSFSHWSRMLCSFSHWLRVLCSSCKCYAAFPIGWDRPMWPPRLAYAGYIRPAKSSFSTRGQGASPGLRRASVCLQNGIGSARLANLGVSTCRIPKHRLTLNAPAHLGLSLRLCLLVLVYHVSACMLAYSKSQSQATCLPGWWSREIINVLRYVARCRVLRARNVTRPKLTVKPLK